MNLGSIDIDWALRRLAERRIEEATREGKFHNLAGAGQPLDLEPMPAEENARLMWWAIRILKQNDFVPDEVQWRKALDRLREKLDAVNSVRELPALVAQMNHFVHTINTLGTNALKAPFSPLCLATERARL